MIAVLDTDIDQFVEAAPAQKAFATAPAQSRKSSSNQTNRTRP